MGVIQVDAALHSLDSLPWCRFGRVTINNATVSVYLLFLFISELSYFIYNFPSSVSISIFLSFYSLFQFSSCCNPYHYALWIRADSNDELPITSNGQIIPSGDTKVSSPVKEKGEIIYFVSIYLFSIYSVIFIFQRHLRK